MKTRVLKNLGCLLILCLIGLMIAVAIPNCMEGATTHQSFQRHFFRRHVRGYLQRHPEKVNLDAELGMYLPLQQVLGEAFLDELPPYMGDRVRRHHLATHQLIVIDNRALVLYTEQSPIPRDLIEQRLRNDDQTWMIENQFDPTNGSTSQGIEFVEFVTDSDGEAEAGP